MNEEPGNKAEKRSWMGRFMAFFFYHLYHTFAGFYDQVAFIVSLGHWNNWVTGIVPFITGPLILEIGFGPGHLQEALNQFPNLTVFGLDESSQMARLALRRIRKRKPDCPGRLVQAKAEHLPYPSSSFKSVVATFPTPYIIYPDTLQQIMRVLEPGGSLVVLLAARHPNDSLPVKLMEWLFRVTGQAPPTSETSSRITRFFLESGFIPSLSWESTPSGKLLILIARKPES